MSKVNGLKTKAEKVLASISEVDENGYGLNSILAISENLDKEIESAAQIEGPLSGELLVIKDNIESLGLPATAGSLALANTPVEKDSSISARIKAAGGLIIAAANLSEWANIRSSNSTSGWSAVGGLTANPWIHSHNAGGSSSGTGAAVASGLFSFGVGTETDGSIICPASLNGCIGLKPTVGLIPRDGVIPISSSQDSPGPMTQRVIECEKLLGVLSGTDYSSAKESETKIRFGFVRNWLTKDEAVNAHLENAIRKLSSAGHEVIEIATDDPSDEMREDEFEILLRELSEDLTHYLSNRSGSRVKSLTEVVSFNLRESKELAHFDQDLLDKALTLAGRDENYRVLRQRNLSWATETLNQILKDVDVAIGCTYGPAWKSTLGSGDQYSDASWITMAPAIAGTPIGTLPMGFVGGLPVGIGVVARKLDELRLLNAMYALEKHLGLGVLTPTFVKN